MSRRLSALEARFLAVFMYRLARTYLPHRSAK